MAGGVASGASGLAAPRTFRSLVGDGERRNSEHESVATRAHWRVRAAKLGTKAGGGRKNLLDPIVTHRRPIAHVPCTIWLVGFFLVPLLALGLFFASLAADGASGTYHVRQAGDAALNAVAGTDAGGAGGTDHGSEGVPAADNSDNSETETETEAPEAPSGRSSNIATVLLTFGHPSFEQARQTLSDEVRVMGAILGLVLTMSGIILKLAATRISSQVCRLCLPVVSACVRCVRALV